MKLVLIVLALLLAPSLAVVPSRDTVMPGDLVSVTVTGDVESTFDSGGLEVVTDTLGLPTRYIWLRAAGPPRDVRVRAWGSGASSEATIRVCCVEFPAAVDGTRRVWLPVIKSP